ncbi:SufE family protein [Alphaproteobacteria bacterium KMM 3653]|uniref:SufE family protein n=1 Tax=Harenicola maris TaxID=2841044 RepID=A0AAP2CNW9_9RHOB|nr:SufE family protein [Harenicola maris]
MAQAPFEELVETFEFLDDWEDRYRTVIDLGKDMVPLAEGERVDTTKVLGCASQVWLVPQVEGQGPDAILTFRGESDAMIVQGLIAVLQCLYSGLPVREVAATDAQAELGRLGLTDHLSAQRSNGLRAMVERLQQIAAAAQA